jgi:hypothetical protein
MSSAVPSWCGIWPSDHRPAWPVCAAEAAAHPVVALFTFPVQIGAVRVATLDTYRATPGPLRPGDLSTVLRVADIAALALSGLRADDGRWLDGDARWMEGGGTVRYDRCMISPNTGDIPRVGGSSPPRTHALSTPGLVVA